MSFNPNQKSKARKLHTFETIPNSKQLTEMAKNEAKFSAYRYHRSTFCHCGRSHKEEVLYNRKRKNRQIDLMHAPLNGIRMRKVNLSGVFFYQADLVCAVIRHSNFVSSNFSESRMIGANFESSDCSNCAFVHTILCSAKLVNVNFTNSSFRRAILDESDLSRANLNNADLRDSLLCGVNFARAKLTNANLSGADLRGAKGLTQKQLKVICHSPDSEPKIDEHLVWDKNEAIRRWTEHWKGRLH